MATNTDTSADAVERFILDYHHTQTYADMTKQDDGEWVQYSDYETPLAERDQLQAQVEKAAVGLRESIKQLRVIAGMDLMGASSIAYNAAREAEATLDQIVAYRKARGEG